MSDTQRLQVFGFPGNSLLEPGATMELQVRYTPAADESLQEQMTVFADDPDQAETFVLLEGEGLAPRLEVSPASVDFGESPLGCANTELVTLRNTGRGVLTLAEPAFEQWLGEGLSMNEGLLDGQQLITNAERTVAVSYVPGALGAAEGQVTVFSDDPAEPELAVPLSGSAVEVPVIVETFVWPKSGVVDILWVVDSSAGMDPIQQDLAAAAGAFVDALEDHAPDYQVAVISGDGSSNGLLQAPIITPTTAQPADAFAEAVVVGDASWSPRIFDQAYLALSSPNTDPGGASEGLVRPDAGLCIISVTSEQEQSTLLDGGSPSAYVSWFQALKPGLEVLRMFDVSGGLTGCSGDGGSATSGSDLVMASVLTGGYSASFCDPNRAGIVATMVSVCAQGPDTVALSSTPVEGSVELSRSSDGVNFTVQTSGWSHPEPGRIVFETGWLPDPGDTIKVEYLEACEP